jgi:TonB family protein
VAVAHFFLVRPMKHLFFSICLVLGFLHHAAAQAPTPSWKGDLIFRARPEYPVEARRARLQGRGTYALHVRKDGTVGSVDVQRSTGHRILDQAAIATFRKYRFRSGPVRVYILPMEFTIVGGQPDRGLDWMGRTNR